MVYGQNYRMRLCSFILRASFILLQVQWTSSCEFDWECAREECCMSHAGHFGQLTRHCVQQSGNFSLCARPKHCTKDQDCHAHHYPRLYCKGYSPQNPHHGVCLAAVIYAVPNPCYTQACEYRGRCIDIDWNRLICQCPPPYTNYLCQYGPPPPPLHSIYLHFPSTVPQPCKPTTDPTDSGSPLLMNGDDGSGCGLCQNNAMCNDNLDSSMGYSLCICEDGFTGEFCETAITHWRPEPN